MQRSNPEKYRHEVVGKARGVVLEIGFGSGLNISHYLEVSELYALEPSKELFEMAKENIANAKFPIHQIIGSAEKIPLDDNSVDDVVSTWVMCSIPNIKIALQEVKRVLKPGGHFIFLEHGLSPGRLSARLQHILTPITKSCSGGCYLDRNIEGLINESGLKMVSIKKFGLRMKPLAYVYKGVAVKR